jgi:hypothetical protein
MSALVTFDALQFSAHKGLGNTDRAVMFFDNGYGVSVVCGTGTYGGGEGLYELGVIIGNPKSYTLTYATPVTDDVLGYLTEQDVTDTMAKVAALEASQ